MLDLFPCHFSDLIALQLLLEIAHCVPLSPKSVSSHLISTHLISAHVFSVFSPHLISSHCSLLSPCHLSMSHLFPSHLSSYQYSTALLNSSQLSAAHVSSSSRFQLLSARLTSSHLFSAHSQIISALLWPKTCSKNGSQHQTKRPLRFPQRRFYTEKLVHLHRESCTHRSFYTETGKLLLTASFYTASFYTGQAFTQKPLHREAFKRCKL